MTKLAPLRRLGKLAAVLEIILGVGAVGGGLVLMAGPNGEIFPLPVAALAGSPFSNYFVPGAILFAVLGLGPLGAAVFAWRRNPLAPFLMFTAAGALLIWLIVEIAVFGYSNHPPLQALYLGLGVVMVSVGVAWMRQTLRSPLSILAAFPLALLMSVTSLAGILFPATYARESANWTAQAIGQDWVDLLLAAPWLAITGVLALRGSRRALMLLAGGFFYAFYTFAIYGFTVHFNGLFLVYCAGLGFSFFALAAITGRLFRGNITGWYAQPAPVRTIGIFLVTVGVLFAVAWLGEIVPAIARDTIPRSIAESGAATNPVHVLDLSLVIPIHLIAGISLLRRRPAGYALAPVVLGFGVLMAASISVLMLSMRKSGFEMSWIVFGAMTLLSVAEAVALVLLLRRFSRCVPQQAHPPFGHAGMEDRQGSTDCHQCHRVADSPAGPEARDCDAHDFLSPYLPRCLGPRGPPGPISSNAPVLAGLVALRAAPETATARSSWGLGWGPSGNIGRWLSG